MKPPNRKWTVTAIIAGMALASTPSFASRPITTIVTGTVTSVGADQVTVDGKSYNVALQSSALHSLTQLHEGDQVQLVLNGPPASTGARVVAIQVRHGS